MKHMLGSHLKAVPYESQRRLGPKEDRLEGRDTAHKEAGKGSNDWQIDDL